MLKRASVGGGRASHASHAHGRASYGHRGSAHGRGSYTSYGSHGSHAGSHAGSRAGSRAGSVTDGARLSRVAASALLAS